MAVSAVTQDAGIALIAGGAQDPLQGFDITVFTTQGPSAAATGGGGQLGGTFTAAMWKIVNQTETYLCLNSRVPRMLDGEIVTVWSLEQGYVAPNFVSNTFGTAFALGYAAGRTYKVPRANRFNIHMRVNAMLPGAIQAGWEDEFNIDNGSGASIGDQTSERGGLFGATNITSNQVGLSLYICRVDTASFGAAAGRHVVANSWQGTAEYIRETGVASLNTQRTSGFGVSSPTNPTLP